MITFPRDQDRFLYKYGNALKVSGVGVTTLLIGGGISALYGYQRFRSYRKQMGEENIKVEIFEKAQLSCMQTYMSFIPELAEQITQFIPIPDSDDIAQSKHLSKEDKVMFWENMKTNVMIHLFSSLYTLLLSHMMLQCQVNLLSGHLFHQDHSDPPSSIFQYIPFLSSSTERTEISPKVKSAFLTCSSYIIDVKLEKVVETIQQAILPVLKDYPLLTKMDYNGFTSFLNTIRIPVESALLNSAFLGLLLPEENPSLWTPHDLLWYQQLELDEKEKAELDMLLNETRNTLDRLPFRITLNNTIQMATNFFLQQMSGFFYPNKEELASVEIPLVQLVPKIMLTLDDYMLVNSSPFVDSLFHFTPLREFAMNLFQSPMNLL